MFSANMKKDAKIKVIIDGVRPKIVKSFIEYLYLKKIDNLDPIAQELFDLTEKCQVLDLKVSSNFEFTANQMVFQEKCVESMSKTFNKDNALDRVKLAFMHNNDVLKKHALDYICDKDSEGNFQAILKSEDWKKFALGNKQLADDITDAVFANSN